MQYSSTMNAEYILSWCYLRSSIVAIIYVLYHILVMSANTAVLFQFAYIYNTYEYNCNIVKTVVYQDIVLISLLLVAILFLYDQYYMGLSSKSILLCIVSGLRWPDVVTSLECWFMGNHPQMSVFFFYKIYFQVCEFLS